MAAPDEAKIWRYSLPNVKSEGWAIVYMDSYGFFAVASDFGNYIYHWPRGGLGKWDFRDFILSCDDGYLASKLSMEWPQEFNAGRTRAGVREAIAQARRHDGLEADLARELWDAAGYIEDAVSWAAWLEGSTDDERCGGLDWYPDAYELGCYDQCPQVQRFLLRVMPRIRVVIAADLENERCKKPPTQTPTSA